MNSFKRLKTPGKKQHINLKKGLSPHCIVLTLNIVLFFALNKAMELEDNRGSKVLVLHVANPGLIPSTASPDVSPNPIN